MFGYDEASEVVGKTPLDFVAPESRDLVRQRVSSGYEEPYEAVGLKKDGTTFDIEVRGRITSYRGHNVRVTALRDITERKRAEEALRRSEARNRAVVETASDAILTMTTNGLIHSFNPAAERIFGYTAEETAGQPLRMLMPERFRSPHEAGFRRYLGGGEAHVVNKGPVELAGLRKNGEEFPLELALGEMREEGDILFTGIIRDITERKQAEEDLRQAEEQYRGLVETVQEGIGFITQEGVITYCNEAYADIFGLAPDELTGKSLLDFLDEEQKEKVLRQRDLRLEGVRSTYEFCVTTVDGVRKDLSATGSPITGPDGSYEGAVQTIVDVTERKQAEEARLVQARQAALRTEVSEALAKGGPLPGALQQCSEAMIRHLSADLARVWTFNAQENVLELQASAGLYVDLGGPMNRVPVGESIGRIVQDRKPYMTNDIQSDPRFGGKEWAQREGLTATANYPLTIEDELVGRRRPVRPCSWRSSHPSADCERSRAGRRSRP